MLNQRVLAGLLTVATVMTTVTATTITINPSPSYGNKVAQRGRNTVNKGRNFRVPKVKPSTFKPVIKIRQLGQKYCQKNPSARICKSK